MENKITFAAIQRHTSYSPNHIGNDSAIFNGVAKKLIAKGHSVHFYTEQEFILLGVEENYVFTMLRNKAAIKRLQQLQKEKGVVSINSAFGIENCNREQMTKLLLKSGISHPKSWIFNISEGFEKIGNNKEFSPLWIKRADFHAIHREDVTFVRSEANLKSVLAEYALRGIERVVVNEHLEGDLIKFYGVYGTPFFYWFYPYHNQHSKFGLEEINGIPKGILFDKDELKALCNEAAKVLNVQVYGGDCIVSPNGKITLIDFNDWPSFAPCREEASEAITEIILKTIAEHVSTHG
ncbi:MAG: hypothetical protein GX963_07440 [Bacteroidales bacterium]|nr:hypothetical protein [Bacteroidales bacterium]